METTIGTRIELLISKKEKSVRAFSLKIGFQPPTTHQITSGRNKPGFDFLVSILDKYPDVSADWLLLGKGEMLKLDGVKEKGREVAELKVKDMEIEHLKEKIVKLEADNAWLKDLINPAKIKKPSSKIKSKD